MKVLIDTNVIVSAALKDKNPEGDHDFTEARKLVNTTIISVSLFKKLVCDA